jgi:hypothetical protein
LTDDLRPFGVTVTGQALSGARQLQPSSGFMRAYAPEGGRLAPLNRYFAELLPTKKLWFSTKGSA